MGEFHVLLNKRATVMSTVALTVIGGGVAVAYWTNSGVSNGYAKVANPSLEVSAPTTTDAPLSPGGPAQKFVFTVKNTGDAPALLKTIAFSVATSDGTPWDLLPTYGVDCGARDFTVGTVKVVAGTSSAAFAEQSLPANTTLNLSVDLTMTNDTARSQDGCKGQQPPLYVSVS